MKQLLRALERLLACQRAQFILTPIVDDFLNVWRQAVAEGVPRPEVYDLVAAAAAEGLAIPYAPTLFRYVTRCEDAARVPARNRIIHSFLHGVGEQRNPFASHPCACLARADLMPPKRDPDDDDDE